MILTRCRLRHGRVRCSLVLRIFYVSVTIISVITKKFSFFSKTKNTQMNCFCVNISCICLPLFAQLRKNLIFLMGWFFIELTTTNLVLNALVDDKFCVLFFSCFLIFHNSIKKQRKNFFLNCNLWGASSRS